MNLQKQNVQHETPYGCFSTSRGRLGMGCKSQFPQIHPKPARGPPNKTLPKWRGLSGCSLNFSLSATQRPSTRAVGIGVLPKTDPTIILPYIKTRPAILCPRTPAAGLARRDIHHVTRVFECLNFSLSVTLRPSTRALGIGVLPKTDPTIRFPLNRETAGHLVP